MVGKSPCRPRPLGVLLTGLEKLKERYTCTPGLLATGQVQAIPGSSVNHNNVDILYGIRRWRSIQASDLSASDGWAFAYHGNDG